MKGIDISTLTTTALAVLTFAGGATPQTPPVLNALEVRTLVASSEPADNATLSAHFAALADRYAADARRHKSMAQAFFGIPAKRVAGNGAAEHCTRLAELDAESARILRELAAHHQKLAVGVPSAAPRGSSRFQAGAGAPQPTDAELAALAGRAHTPSEHRGLEEYFLTAAKRYTADANEHAAMAQAYRGTRIAQAAVHCDRLAQLGRDEAKEATAAAEMHKGLALIAR